MELKDKLDKINEDYLKEFANDEIQKLKSRIKELESYIEEWKDITSKADDVIRNCKCKMFRPYRDELKNQKRHRHEIGLERFNYFHNIYQSGYPRP